MGLRGKGVRGVWCAAGRRNIRQANDIIRFITDKDVF